jgi:hypothetical protein
MGESRPVFHVEKGRFSAAGDPNGTRTRVFAVKGNSSTKSMRRPASGRFSGSLSFNGLREVGDGFAPPKGEAR